MIGKTISHYKILEELGCGGMGIVYKAQDLKLDRFVALKFLPLELTRDVESKKRFIHEAQAASALQHNNICTIHDIDQTDDGQLFICLDYYEGETLKKKIEQGPLKIDEALDISMQIAQGLTKAHEQNIIHRDIKPANILLTKDGVAKILDFGLAKLSGRTKVTVEGTTLGTVAYMSPEQTRGEEVDQRTDLWSLGVMLYEMVTGQTPFKGDYDQAVMYSIVNEQPDPPTGLRSGVPLELERIVNKCLNKSNEERYQHSDELAADLKKIKKEIESEKTVYSKSGIPEPKKPVKKARWLQPATILITVIVVALLIVAVKWIFEQKTEKSLEKAIAVLPFTSITTAEEDEIFSDGIHDDILTHLAKIKDLKVIARTSVMQYKNTTKRIRDIGKELGVYSILEGSVRRIGTRIRIVAQLNNAQTEEHIWAETYDRDYNDVFAIQSDVAQKIALALKATLTEREKKEIDRIPTSNMQAWEYYQRGNYYWMNYDTREGNEEAIKMYEKAVELDSTFALAYAKLSIVHSTLYDWHYIISEEHLNKAESALRKATRLEPDHPEIHFAQGYYLQTLKQFNRALDEYKLALEGMPNNQEVLFDISQIYYRQKNMAKAIEYLIKCYQLNPRAINQAIFVALAYMCLREWPEAEKWCKTQLAINPENRWAWLREAQIQIYGYGDLEKARQIIAEGQGNIKSGFEGFFIDVRWKIEIYSRTYEEAFKLIKENKDSYLLLKALTWRYLGNTQKANACFDSAKIHYRMEVKKNSSSFLFHSFLGLSYAGLGLDLEAIKEGKKAIELFENEFYGYPGTNPWPPLNLAYIYILLGQNDEAINQLKICLSEPGDLTFWRLKLDPIYDQLRESPEFQKLIE